MPGRSTRPSPRPRPGAGVPDAHEATSGSPAVEFAPAVEHPSSEAARLRKLIEAQAVINSDLTLSAMLQRIVLTACELVGARYGALGVVGHDGTLEQVVHHGLDAATVSAIGTMPPRPSAPSGLLDTMIAADASSPAFLGVPIQVRDEKFGDIYLAEATGGHFTAADEELVTALAATAGTAIANARLYEDAQRSRDWLHASGEVTRALLAEADVDTLLDVVSRALHVAEADAAALVLPAEDGRQLTVAIAVGRGAERFSGVVFDPANSAMGRLIAKGESALLTDLSSIARSGFDNTEDYGPVILAPLADAKGVRGAVIVVRTRERAAFTPRDLDLATTFADQVALALEMNDARTDAEWLRVLEVRHQLAQDLHDNVIQRLFATGMGLHTIAEADLPVEITSRLARYITELDDTIDEIRERVFGLREDSRKRPRRRGRFARVQQHSGDRAANATTPPTGRVR